MCIVYSAIHKCISIRRQLNSRYDREGVRRASQGGAIWGRGHADGEAEDGRGRGWRVVLSPLERTQ